jgi:hypothetical protein
VGGRSSAPARSASRHSDASSSPTVRDLALQLGPAAASPPRRRMMRLALHGGSAGQHDRWPRARRGKGGAQWEERRWQRGVGRSREGTAAGVTGGRRREARRPEVWSAAGVTGGVGGERGDRGREARRRRGARRPEEGSAAARRRKRGARTSWEERGAGRRVKELMRRER